MEITNKNLKIISESPYKNPSKLEDFNNINPTLYYYVAPEGFYEIDQIFVKKYLVHIHYTFKGVKHRQLRMTGLYGKIWGLKRKLDYESYLEFKINNFTTLGNLTYVDKYTIFKITKIEVINNCVYIFNNKNRYVRMLDQFNKTWYLLDCITDYLTFD